MPSRAWGAKIAFTDIGLEDGTLVVADDMGGGLYQHAYDVGARIHSDSWGYSTDWYVEESRETDAYAHASRDFLPMFALGNDGPSLGTVGAPANAKNILAVGATLSDSSVEPTHEGDPNGPRWLFEPGDIHVWAWTSRARSAH